MCEGLNANVHISQTSQVLFSPSIPLSYPFKHESICLLTYPPHTSHCSPAECLLKTSLSTLLFLHSLLLPSLYILYVLLSLSCCHITIWLPSSGQWSVLMAVSLSDSCWHTRGLLRYHLEAVGVALLRGHTRPTSEMDVLSGVPNHVWLHTHLHIWTDYFQSGRNPLSVPEGVAVTAWPDGPPERAHYLTVPWPPLTDVSFALITDFGKHAHPHK